MKNIILISILGVFALFSDTYANIYDSQATQPFRERSYQKIEISKTTNPANIKDPCDEGEEVNNLEKDYRILEKNHVFRADSEIDLHGKKVKRAKVLLNEFFANALKEGKEYVLVITGKGLHSKTLKILSDGSEVGPIKYNFLMWMQNKEFDEFIDDFSYAHGAHGGEGAFYISLKKPKSLAKPINRANFRTWLNLLGLHANTSTWLKENRPQIV